eukprot:3810495-Rhodomonas_salina.1
MLTRCCSAYAESRCPWPSIRCRGLSVVLVCRFETVVWRSARYCFCWTARRAVRAAGMCASRLQFGA